MKKLMVLLAAVLVLGASGIAMAGATATQTVTYEVQAINELSVSGDPAALVISAAVAGSPPTQVSNAATTFAITTNETRKITGAIDTNMPASVTLTVALAAPTGGTSTGDTTLTTAAADLVTGISALNESGKTITYKLSATSAAGVVASDTRTVTLTIAAP